jgi:hypothetical protein
MLCRICDSDEHLAARCPHRGSGKGQSSSSSGSTSVGNDSGHVPPPVVSLQPEEPPFEMHSSASHPPPTGQDLILGDTDTDNGQDVQPFGLNWLTRFFPAQRFFPVLAESYQTYQEPDLLFQRDPWASDDWSTSDRGSRHGVGYHPVRSTARARSDPPRGDRQVNPWRTWQASHPPQPPSRDAHNHSQSQHTWQNWLGAAAAATTSPQPNWLGAAVAATTSPQLCKGHPDHRDQQ